MFRFNIDVLAFVDDKKEWAAEKGDFEFYVGANSKDKAFTLSYTLQETKKVDPNQRTFYAVAEER